MPSARDVKSLERALQAARPGQYAGQLEMAGQREPFGVVLTAEVIAAIERRKERLGSPTLTSAEVEREGYVGVFCPHSITRL